MFHRPFPGKSNSPRGGKIPNGIENPTRTPTEISPTIARLIIVFLLDLSKCLSPKVIIHNSKKQYDYFCRV